MRALAVVSTLIVVAVAASLAGQALRHQRLPAVGGHGADARRRRRGRELDPRRLRFAADGRVAVSGLDGTARFDDGLADGRYARRFHIAIMGPNGDVYDGRTLWSQDVGGGVRPIDSPFARRQARSQAYLARRDYLAESGDATVTCLGERADGARSADLRHARPAASGSSDDGARRRPERTHLLANASMRVPLETSLVTYGDYRAVDGIVLPYSIASGTKVTPNDDYALTVTHYDVLRHERDADFAKPVAPDDERMVGGVASTTLPMMLEGRQLMIWASIDGHAAMPFILDTGGHAILTAQAAQTLGLLSSGAGESGGSGPGKIATQYTRVGSVRIGAAELLDQPFLVIPYPYSFYERGKGAPLAGIIGLEFFERFAARLDYGDRKVTFWPLTSFRYRGSGTALPFTFETDPDEPMIDAAVDGYDGQFGIDTGNSGNLILFGTYLEKTGLLSRYEGGILIIGRGTGGTNTGRVETVRRFTIAGHTLYDVSSTFTQMSAGAFAAWTQAGNVGLSVLSRFVPTFDYADRIVFLEAAKREGPPFRNGAGIAIVKNEPGAFDVLMVRAGSPAAAAGIASGDRITGVDGGSAEAYSNADVFNLFAQPAGTVVRLRVQHGSATRDVVLTLY